MCAELLIVALTFLAIGFGHYLPWGLVSSLVNKRGELHRPFAYAYGVGTIWLAMRVMAEFKPELSPAITPLTWLILAAGAGATIPRLVADLKERKDQEEDLSEREAARVAGYK